MIQESSFLNIDTIHPSWVEFFEKPTIQKELLKIEDMISGKPFTPKVENVLRFANVDIEQIKVIILGMDPYPTQRENGQLYATGRAFEVQGTTSWFDSEISPSLKNVVKLIHKMYFDYEKSLAIQEVRNDIEINSFPIPTPDKAFDYWEKQGALWLNTAFTCEIGGRIESGSHLSHWKTFFSLLLEYIVEKNSSIRYFLWGNDAIKFGKKLKTLGVVESFLYESKHPCTNGDKGGYERKSSFLENPCFYETKDIINWVMKSE
jgi:uracil-DNA glycosylase